MAKKQTNVFHFTEKSDFDKIGDFLGARSYRVSADNDTDRLRFSDDKQKHVVMAGEYIIKNADGTFTISGTKPKTKVK